MDEETGDAEQDARSMTDLTCSDENGPDLFGVGGTLSSPDES